MFKIINTLYKQNRILFSYPKIIINFSTQTKSQVKKKTYYQILQLPNNAAQASIKKNYLKLAKIYHPDVYKGKDKSRFQNIQQAYQVLKNVSERRKYDQSLGLRKTEQSSTYQYKRSEQNTEAQYKPKNDFDYEAEVQTEKPKQQLNIDEEYQKFFKKKSTTHFQQIRMHEDAQFRNMNPQQRTRRRVSQIYRDEKEQYQKMYQKSFNQILNDQVELKNNMYEDQIKQQQIIEERNKPKSKKKFSYIAIGITILLAIYFYPKLYRLTNFIITQKQIKKKAQNTRFQIQQKISQANVRSRLVF